MIPLAWLRALKQPNGQPFLADSLGRYGYLPNPANSDQLPVGFTASGPTGSRTVGMTCAACHTRQVTAEGKSYRIDGGPGIVDFQSFLADLDSAVGQVRGSDAAFNSFANAVLNSTAPDPDDVVALHQNVDAWYLRYHTLITRALPTPAWGPARLDAVGMIFNRLTGLDLGPPPNYIIASNIKRADAPVRYPFLWNAPVQDETQWPGFADNGNDILGLARNLGEVLGVFGVFAPTNNGFFVDYLSDLSANFDGLTHLENLVKQIGPPKWPWPVDGALASQGKAIYERPTAQGGCSACHGITPGKVRRIKGIQMTLGIRDANPRRRDFTEHLETLRAATGDPLPPHTKQALIREHQRLCLLERQIKEIEVAQAVALKATKVGDRKDEGRAGEERDTGAAQAAALIRLKGIGQIGAVTLIREAFYRHFDTRREVASYFGLTPSPFNSGTMRVDQGISKAGNPRIRTLAIELSWLWLRHQPESALTSWFLQRVGNTTGRIRRIAIVALARKLMIRSLALCDHWPDPEGAVLRQA
jgi:hypothetical protein